MFSSLSLCKKWFISRLCTKNHPSGRFCVRNHRSKNVSEKFRRGFSPLSPPGSAYGNASKLHNKCDSVFRV